MSKGVVFTVGTLMLLLILLGLGTAVRARWENVHADQGFDKQSAALLAAQRDVADAFFAIGGIDKVRVRANATVCNISLDGNVTLSDSIDISTDLSTYLDFYSDAASQKMHTSMLWVSPNYVFKVMPYDATITPDRDDMRVVAPTNVTFIELRIRVPVDVTVTNGWSDEGAGYPLVSVHLTDSNNVQTFSYRRNPSSAISYLTMSDGMRIGYGRDSVAGTLHVDNATAWVTNLSIGFNATDTVWLQTSDTLTLGVAGKSETHPLVLALI